MTDWLPRTAGKTLCRSCGAGFRARLGTEAVIACPADRCQAWAASYREALRLGADLPPEYGMAPPAPRGVDPVKAKRARRKMRHLESIAIGNELRQEQRERAAEARGVETVTL